jgi:hypothetical protein
VNLRPLACAAVLLAALTHGAFAEKPRPARPAGKDIAVDVMRGGSVRIPLRGFERNLNRLEYRPLAQPRHGRLSNLEQYGGPDRQGPGYITYTHGDDDDSTSDTFTFEVKAPLTKLTGRGRVTIRILDQLAKLQITPSTLDFGEVAVGDPPARRVVELANIGGGVIQGFVEPPEPFAVEGDGSFVLPRGQSTRIAISFAPRKVGALSFPIQPAPGDSAVLTLRGEALAPFKVSPEKGSFSPQEDGSRTAPADVSNLSRRPLQVSVVLPPESPVEPLPDFILAPGETTRVVLYIPPDDKKYLSDFDLRFESDGHAETRQFSAPAIPAKLVIVSAPDFGEMGTRRGIPQTTLVLRNEGGATADVKLLPNESVFTADGITAFSIAPDAELSLPLVLRLKKDQPLPTTVTLSLQGRDIPVPITAKLAEPTPTPTPFVPPTPPAEPAVEWALNSEIEYVPPPAGPSIRWVEKAGWTNYVLQYRPTGSGAWQNYRLPAPPEGLIGWVQQLWEKIGGFLSTPIKRKTIEELSGEVQKFGQAELAPDAVDSPDVWRLQAESVSSGKVHSVTENFRITADNKLTAVAPPPAPALATPTTTTAARPRPLGPVTDIASAGIKPERRSALLQIAFAPELDIRSFRLERGAMVSALDPKTGIPQAPVFEKLDPPEATVEILGLAEGEADGRKLTVCLARIDDLVPGTRTYWRLVPAGPDGDLPPTTVLLVDTLPLPPFPWNKVLLFVLFALLAGVLCLRWRLNRAPH